tara:strand:- start:83 stop:712 length:630 start_codon:yes stop_codon:yes gene_type:complete
MKTITFSISREWANLYSESVNNYALNFPTHILTDTPAKFSNCIVTEYDKEYFSYYEKILFAVKKCIELKDTILFLDVDSFNSLNTSILDYTEQSALFHRYYVTDLITDWGNEFNPIIDYFEENDIEYKDVKIFHERGFVLPYTPSLSKVYDDLIKIQSLWEKTFDRECDILKYNKSGVGFVEGIALSIMLNHNNIKSEISDKIFLKYII